MTLDQVQQLLQAGETFDVEFKGEETHPLSDNELVEAVLCLSNRPSNSPGYLIPRPILPALLVSVAFLPSQGAMSADSKPVAARLDNGLEVFVVEKHAAPVVAVQVWYRVGSQHEKDGVRGIAHLFEHPMFRGSANYGPEEHHRLLAELGGSSNAYTFLDRTVYFERLPASDLQLALQLEADRMARLALTQEALDTEREIVKEELRGYQDDPFFQLVSRTLQLLYSDHPYSLTPLGRMEDIEGITLADCKAFYSTYYAPNNAVVVIVGDVKAAQAIEQCRRCFSPIPPKPAPAQPDLALSASKAGDRHKLAARIPIRGTAVAYRIPAASHPDILPLRVLAFILSEGESSRLVKALVREKELAVMVLGYPLVAQGPGVFACVAAHFPHVSSQRIERAIYNETEQLGGSISAQELEKARNQLLFARVLDRYTAEDLAASLGFAEVVQGDYQLFEEDLERLRTLTLEDLQRVAAAYLTRENSTAFHFEPARPNPFIWAYGLLRELAKSVRGAS